MIPQTVTPADAQFVGSALAVIGIEKAKNWSKLPWITKETDAVNRIVAVALSFLGSIGIDVSFHAGVLSISNLTLPTAIAALMFFGRSLAGQELIYRVVKMSGHLSDIAGALASAGHVAEVAAAHDNMDEPEPHKP